jgi:hypothetical protein
MLRRLTQNLEADRELTRVATFEVVKVPDVLANDPYRALFRQAVVALLREGQRRGEVRRGLDPEVAGSAIVGVYLQQVFEWCLADPPYALTERIETIVGLLWEGVGGARG